ncbi:MAG: alcohol dehydrogenase catalytic domain-containing protein [Bryobacterales bacterium]
MKAIRIHEHGGPEVLRYEDAPEPEPKPNEVLVRVKACALNHLDLFVRGGIPGLKLTMPHILGSDAAGEVVSVGSLCTRVKPGDRILVAPGKQSWQSPEAMRGLDNFAPDYGLLGYHYPGLQAELVAIPESNALSIPGELSFEQAASIPLVFQTAWHMLVGLAKIRFCEDVLILGGSSGVGIAAIQIAKLHHCRVIATAGETKRSPRPRPSARITSSTTTRRTSRPRCATSSAARVRHRLRACRQSHLGSLGRLSRPSWALGHLRRHHRR